MPRVTFNARDLESAGYEATVKAKQRNAIKKEIEYPLEQQQQVFHRKSERRRVARDIFLVFEEQPSSRRGGSNKKKTPPKSKFGHLKVEDPNKNKSLLRDIKNEPKCYLSSCPVSKSQKVPNAAANVFKSVPQIPPPNTDTIVDNPIARVNPIFLWVKQDDTRIVEVRCEDYDKRNRIRLTKTTNGWRAIPRTDPSSSRIVKFFQTPLLKVKREVYEKRLIENTDDDTTSVLLDSGGFDAAFINSNSNTETQDVEALGQQQPTIQKGKRIRRKSKKGKTKGKKTSMSITDSIEAVVEEAVVEEAAVEEADNTIETSEEPFANVGKVQEETITDYDEDSQVSTNANYGEYEYDGKDNDLSETYHKHTPVAELQLCPKTGLFLPNTTAENIDNYSSVPMTKDIMVDLVNCHIECTKTQTENNIENIDDSDTKNLKDLLDDDDLLQHCGDNLNSGAELIDSLVKRSCENNLIQEAEVHKDSSVSLTTFSTATSGNDLIQEESVVEAIPQIIDTGSDSPKCLSFNEAGEIEGLNGELFQSHSFIDTFDKVPVEEISPLDSTKLSDTIDVPMIQTALIEDKLVNDVIIENNIPKDLSYKKREEVCPQSESRSQCAVTSSSDVIKSPTQNAIPAIDSTSEAIKSLIFKQFVKLNSLNTMPNSVGKQQSEPIDLGKHRDKDIDTAANESSQPTTNYIETVVIDDNSDDEPMKKRVRSSVNNNLNLTDSSSIIDKDPDPLTQLQLLIRNTQWKVPDPILVPKDRLSAVLASPAREIPLLITTRPELRLPEAFAFPEIIQNPNILVISMAQLEAILKNEMELEKSKTQKPVDEFPDENIRKLNQQNISDIHNEPKTFPPKESNTKCSHAESSLASDINAATLAVLNQMLWLPYFGQLSQEFLKSLKDPMGIQNKYTNLLPLLNPQFGLQHLDELYKNYIKQLSTLKHMNSDSSSNQTPNCPNAMNTFQSPVELAIFQKMMQHQMHNMLRINPLSTDAPQRETMTKTASNQEQSSNAVNASTVEQKKPRRSLADNALPTTYAQPEHNSNNEPSGKSMCLKNIKSNCDNLLADNAEFNNKPRLTCKSLSNLLEPESMNTPAVPLVNLTSDTIKNTLELSKQIDNKIISKDTTCVQPSEPNSHNTARHNKINSILNPQELSKQRKRNINYMEPSIAELSARNPETMNSDSNTALWHPLFGNNSKTGYSSPWQWTTVTATGE